MKFQQGYSQKQQQTQKLAMTQELQQACLLYTSDAADE